VNDSQAGPELIATAPCGTREAEPGSELFPPPAAEPPAGGMLRRWTPILLKFASVQLVVQAIGFGTGILILRNLPKREYALYTLCNTILAAVLVLSDGGISSAMTAIGGGVWHDRGRLSQLMRTALRLRRLMASVALPVVITALVWLLRRNGAGPDKIAVLVTIVLVGCGLELVTRIYAVALRLKSEVREIQKQGLVSAMVKFAVVATAVSVRFNVEIATLSVVAGFAVQYWMLQKWGHTHLDAHAEPDPEMRREIISVVRRQSPHTVYYCLQAQIMVWLISIFGNADRVAEVGALSRLAVVFSILSALMSELLFPAFARIQSPPMVRKRYLQIIFAFAAMSASILCLVALFPTQVLAVLGKQYSHLQREGILMAASSVLGALAGLTWGLNTSRAWIVPPMKFIPVIIVIQVVLVYFLDLSTVRGVLVLSILTAIPSVAWAMGYALLRIHKLQAFA